ncbi:AAA family ATPase [Paracraurococcus lichenis]|uniref:AAA family ATPase n=1 Tax=Paracraurococcus lichenis TaxID=3064888 RepID=A0ABT9DZG1_9PROT|nr:AAA family ATPase [Paracraurococcus sp. LOR1-02]MDO9709287.1 AAA family ATPase [Paracraurococcus sp. LOR1-02]
MLIVFGGLPGTGKTTLAALLARERRATWLRIDAIEQVLRSSGMLRGDVGPSGYMVAYALAEANLRQGQGVIADCVNPLGVTRAAWRGVAAAASSPILEVEVVCSDPVEHRRRVETRPIDLPGLVRPSWDSVQRQAYEPWAGPRIVLDTAGRSIAQAAAELRARIDAAAA